MTTGDLFLTIDVSDTERTCLFSHSFLNILGKHKATANKLDLGSVVYVDNSYYMVAEKSGGHCILKELNHSEDGWKVEGNTSIKKMSECGPEVQLPDSFEKAGAAVLYKGLGSTTHKPTELTDEQKSNKRWW